MKDPVKAIRKMYMTGLASTVKVYDGLAPGIAGIFSVVRKVTFTQRPIKSVICFDVVVQLEVWEAFSDKGNSEGVDNKNDQILQIILPENSQSYLPIDGFTHNSANLVSGSSDSGPVEGGSAFIFRRMLEINHVITQSS